MSRLSRFRTPHVAILVIGLIVAIVAAVGVVDFLSYISSSGYLFVLFWASLAMIRLRKMYPDVKRPFTVPFFPLTAYLAAATCFLIIAFTDWRALLFGAGVIAACGAFYYLYRPVARMLSSRAKSLELAKDRILIPVANPRTAESLVHLASIVAQASEDTSICVLTVVPVSPRLSPDMANRLLARLAPRQKSALSSIAAQAQARNVPLYTKLRAASTVPEAILSELNGHVKLVLMGWPAPIVADKLADNPVKVVLQKAPAHVAVLLDRGLTGVRRILVPIGGGPHSRLAIRLAYEIAEAEDAQLTALHCYCEACEAEELQDKMLQLREIVEDELGSVPDRINTRLANADCVSSGVLQEIGRQSYDLLVVGASDEWISRTRLFGSIDDQLADEVECSVLLVRRHEPAAISWLRRRVKSS
jgi:nucleotide-binding universal stress UspA family protein